MNDISNELSKLRIDQSKRGNVSGDGTGKRVLIVVILLLLLAGGAGAYLYLGRTQPVVVETVRPRPEAPTGSPVLVATGYVIAHHKIQVGSKVAGRVAWIGVEKGDRVRKDQLIVRLEDREYRAQYDQAVAAHDASNSRLLELERGSRPEEIERARADVQKAEAQLRTDQASLKRIENLVQQGVGAPQTLDEALGRFETSKASLEALQKTYELVRKGARSEQIDNARSETLRAKAVAEYAKTIMDATEIRVPISGTILERNVEQGEMVTTSFVGDRGAKSFVVTLADLNDIQVELDINQNDFNRIGPSQPCTVTTDAYPDLSYKCRVDEIAPEANRQKATVQVKVKFLEPDEFVKPEMNARVTFLPREQSVKTESTAKCLIVPKRAIVDREGHKSVFIAVDSTVQTKPVSIQKEVGADVCVSAGLSGSESIIIGDALGRIQAGDRVETK